MKYIVMYLVILALILRIDLLRSSDLTDQASLKRLQCSLGIVRDSDCPIDGEWSIWGTWGSCKGPCDALGRRIRTRECNNPVPSNNGANCVGLDRQTELCQLIDCTMADYKKLVSGDPLRLEKFKEIENFHEKNAALVEKCFTTVCSFDYIKKILNEDTVKFWNAIHCVKHNVGCPVRGGWSEWNSWSACSAQCGLGFRYHIRICNSPLPSEPRLHCPGDYSAREECTGITCAHKQDGTWEDWQAWSPCSETCGKGFSIRKRVCKEPIQKRGVDWGTRCGGTAEEMKLCETKDCTVDGGWSDWEQWGPCSAKCGHGARSRSRTCSNPTASGTGKICTGSFSELESCYERPCGGKTHEVAVFNGESSLLFSPSGRPIRLLHLYVRFLSLSPVGTVIHRYQDDCNYASCDVLRISLQGGILVVLVQINGCSLTMIHPEKLATNEWHEVLIAILGTQASLRIDNNFNVAYSNFSCEPIMPNLDHAMLLGEKFRGQIQEIIINFVPIILQKEKDLEVNSKGMSPYSSTNMVYEMGDDEEGYKKIGDKQFLRAPCPANSKAWKIEISLKPDEASGVILLMTPDDGDSYLLARLDNSRVKLKLLQGQFNSEVENSYDSLPNKWLNVIIAKEEDIADIYMRINGGVKYIIIASNSSADTSYLCEGDFYVGDLTEELLKKVNTDGNIDFLTGVVGYLAVDGTAVDLDTLPEVDQTQQRFSSRMCSTSEHYEEVTMLLGQQLNLTCLYDRVPIKQLEKSRTKEKNALWLRLDRPVQEVDKGGIFTIEDNGRMSMLRASSYTDRSSIEGFYSCWVKGSFSTTPRKGHKSGFIMITIGVAVIDASKELDGIPWATWITAGIITTISFSFTIIWMFYEAYKDYKKGYGFFRDKVLTEEELIEEHLKFIDSKEGKYLLGKKASRSISKSKLQKQLKVLDNAIETDFSDDDDLPPLPPLPEEVEDRNDE